MRLLLVIALAALTGCSLFRKDAEPLPKQPAAPTEPASLKQVGEAIDARAGKVAAAVTVVVENKDKPAVVEAEGRLALSFLPAPTEGELAIAKARASRADQKDYAAAEAAGKKVMQSLDAALAKAKADQAEALRVSQLKDKRIADLEAEVERVKKEQSEQTWTWVGAGLAVIGALTTAFMGPKVGFPLVLCGGFCGAVPHIIDSPWFEYAAGGTLVVSCGLGLWWLADRVKDSVDESNKDLRKNAEIKTGQSPHDDEQAPPGV